MEKKKSDGLPNINENERPHIKKDSLKITCIYVFLGALWIITSDKIIDYFIKDKSMLSTVQTYKGWFYVFLTALVLYFLIKNRLEVINKVLAELSQSNQEIGAANARLQAVEEELRTQLKELYIREEALRQSEERYNLAVQGSNDGIWDWDITKKSYFLSPQWLELIGFTENNLNPNLFLQLIHPDDRDNTLNNIMTYLKYKKGYYENVYRLETVNNGYRWILSKGQAIWNEKGEAVRMAGSHSDITGLIVLEDKIQMQKDFSHSLLENSQVIIIVWNLDGCIINFNSYAEKITGYSKDEMIGTKWCELLLENRTEKLKNIQNKLFAKEVIQNQEDSILCKNGEVKDILWSYSVLYNTEKEPIAIINIGTDITERKEAEKKIYQLAYYDMLTGLPNRILFEKRLQNEINKCCQNSKKLVLLYLDIDDFKKINDTMGYSLGDVLIKKIAQELRKSFEEDENVARMGGDEFAILLTDVEKLKTVTEKIDLIMDIFAQSWRIGGRDYYYTISIGVAFYPDDGLDAQTLLKNADTAMYSAKENGGGTFCYFNPDMSEKYLKYVDLETSLRQALQNDEFILFYQPQIDLLTGKMVGMEALLRWNHPERGMIYPMDFIPFAEKSSISLDIGAWVLRKVLQEIRSLQEKGITPVCTAINLFAKQLQQEEFFEIVKALVEEYKVASDYLELEITEGTAMKNFDYVISVLNKLKGLGIKIALDDFGVGYSSLNYLKRLPIDTLKIDKSFIKDIINRTDDKAIAQALIDMAHKLNLEVVAEGVENYEQMEFLKKHECDKIQGFLFSKPLPKKEIERILQENRSFYL